MQSLDPFTIAILVAAVVILLKLRSILGQKGGHEEDLSDMFNRDSKESGARDEGPSADNVVKLPSRGTTDSGEVEEKNPRIEYIDEIAKPRTKLNRGLKSILGADSNFDPKEFLGGADMAYEMIVNAFAEGDRQTLKNLLSRDVYEGFNAVMDDRDSQGHQVKSSFIGIDKSEIQAAELKDGEAHVTVKFVSQIVSATLDKAGKVIEGDESDIARVTDIWTFARDTRSRDPNWKLVATEAGA